MNSARTPGAEDTHCRARVVVDTNAVLHLWAFSDPRVQALRQAVEGGQLDWLGTPTMRQELAQVLGRGVAAGHGAVGALVLAQWDRWTRPWPPSCASACQHSLRCRDAADQKFLDLALDSKAQWLLTSDKDLLSLARRAARLGLLIRSPQAWTGGKKPPQPEGGGGLSGARVGA